MKSSSLSYQPHLLTLHSQYSGNVAPIQLEGGMLDMFQFPPGDLRLAICGNFHSIGGAAFGNLFPDTNELKRWRALAGCAYGTMWAAPLTVAKVSRFPYSVAQPATFTHLNDIREEKLVSTMNVSYHSKISFTEFEPKFIYNSLGG